MKIHLSSTVLDLDSGEQLNVYFAAASLAAIDTSLSTVCAGLANGSVCMLDLPAIATTP